MLAIKTKEHFIDAFTRVEENGNLVGTSKNTVNCLPTPDAGDRRREVELLEVLQFLLKTQSYADPIPTEILEKMKEQGLDRGKKKIKTPKTIEGALSGLVERLKRDVERREGVSDIQIVS